MKAKDIKREVFSDSFCNSAADNFEEWCNKNPEFDVLTINEGIDSDQEGFLIVYYSRST